MTSPKLVLVFSGKRKSGKDYLTDELLKLISKDVAVIIRLSGPLKEAYAKEKKLSFKRLLEASEYKETYRADMVLWGEKRRNEDPEYFCQLAINKYEAKKFPIWIVSDARRQSDIDYFRKHYRQQTHLCRITAEDSVRQARGWKFTQGIDDNETECGLDQFSNWDVILENDGTKAPKDLLAPCIDLVKKALA